MENHNNKEVNAENEAKINDNKIVLNQDKKEHSNKVIDKQGLSKKDETININERIDNLPFKRIIRAKMGIIQSHLKPKKIIIIKPNQLEGSKILRKPINKLPSL